MCSGHQAERASAINEIDDSPLVCTSDCQLTRTNPNALGQQNAPRQKAFIDTALKGLRPGFNALARDSREIHAVMQSMQLCDVGRSQACGF